jgi:hypothetical protein
MKSCYKMLFWIMEMHTLSFGISAVGLLIFLQPWTYFGDIHGEREYNPKQQAFELTEVLYIDVDLEMESFFGPYCRYDPLL